MMKKFLNEFPKQFSEHLPSVLGDIKSEFELQLRNALKLALEQLNLVTREEFEVQKAVLEKTRERLTYLEDKIATLERQIASNGTV
jgi:BMFP domain-containing protein YqiC